MQQKILMAEYILEHQHLAKNVIPNSGQGKATANRLWEALAVKLNGAGPPVQDAKTWRKVFADQKQNVKKKLSFNKASKQRTGGGPYEEKPLTAADEQIVQAAGLDVSVEGLHSVRCFGNLLPQNESAQEAIEETVEEFLASDEEESGSKKEDEYPTTSRKSVKAQGKTEKLALLKLHLNASEESQSNISSKLDRLIALKERSVALKEEAHKANMAVKELELKIKRLELAALQNSYSK
ncbi:uncharacterized protein LOC118749460 [Rhagoletis pomonella]|uniref:uncharacterized protein LOC118749460 n=1 Tax=Rhagoletis pomonella TaxID=28610 RepID=UPI001781E0F5|nr:uncharacterized protein LOC118749460 [Rhagoletis pomonella]